MNAALVNGKMDTLSTSTVRRLVTESCGNSYKNKVVINSAKTTEYSIILRERWIRLYLKLTKRYHSANVLSIDETAWYFNME